jgi:acyl-CoA thioesterase
MSEIDIGSKNMDQQQLAEACSKAMYQRDQATQALGIELLSVGPGRATLSMRVREDMLNGHRSCHGGLLFTLADSAFAYACNSYNRSTVASGCSIDYVAPGLVGDTLTAVAEERQRSGRTGVYDVTIYNQHQKPLTYFRGKSYQLRGTLLAEPNPDSSE